MGVLAGRACAALWQSIPGGRAILVHSSYSAPAKCRSQIDRSVEHIFCFGVCIETLETLHQSDLLPKIIEPLEQT